MQQLKQLFEGTEFLAVPEFGKKEIPFEGVNKKNILIACDSPLQDSDKAFIRKILSSVQLEPDDVALYALTDSISFHELKAAVNFHKLLLFAITPQQLSLNILHENYKPFSFLGTQILVCDSLSSISNSEKAKSLLWKALKTLFGIK